MNNEINFVTLHPEGINVDLMKDEGQIPYTLGAVSYTHLDVYKRQIQVLLCTS